MRSGRPRRLVFYKRESERVVGAAVTECSVCVWDVVCYCRQNAWPRDHCAVPDLVLQHAKIHNAVPRIVKAER